MSIRHEKLTKHSIGRALSIKSQADKAWYDPPVTWECKTVNVTKFHLTAQHERNLTNFNGGFPLFLD